jgi:sulfatase modifying factor 1
MKPFIAVLSIVVYAGLTLGGSLLGQEPTYTNSIGMEFALIKPGSMQVGVYQPTCPDTAQPNQVGGPGGGLNGFGRPTAGAELRRAPEAQRRAAGAEASAPVAGARQNIGGGAPSGPRPSGQLDPRAVWTSQDLERCHELAKQDSTAGFNMAIRNAYYIGKYEVTQGEWKKLMGSNPSVFQSDKVADDADRHPVDNVTWQDAQAFVRKLNATEKTSAYRLPTEFEWEYAGRAGGPGQVSWTEIRQQAWEQLGNSNKASTHVVGTKMPNAWGLYDMLGNVWEWVQDFYNDKMFPDPVPPKSGTLHVLKGGGFLSDVKNTIYATHAAGPGDSYDVGFRIVRDVK